MFKRSQEHASKFDPAQFDRDGKREFFAKYTPDTTEEYVGEIRLKRSDEEIRNRLDIIRRASDRLTPVEDIEFKSACTYTTSNFERALSDVLLSYLLGNRVKVPAIDLKVFKFRMADRFNVSKMIALHHPEPSSVVDERITVFTFFMKHWLWQSKLDQYVKKFLSPHKERRVEPSADTADDVQFHADTQVVRRCLPFSINMFCGIKNVCHSLFVFWQIRREEAGNLVLEYGVCDGLHTSNYEFLDNYDFHSVFKTAFREFLTEHGVYSDSFTFRFIYTSLKTKEFDQSIHKKIRYTCVSECHRMLLYFAVLYDVFQMHRRESFEDQYNSTAPTASSFLLTRNFKAYQHYMNKMVNWLLESELIWPAPAQTTPTEDRPVCIVKFPGHSREGFASFYRLWAQYPFAEQENACAVMDGRADHITLYNILTKEYKLYYFQWDGDQVFSCSLMPLHGQNDRCVVSSIYSAHDLDSILTALRTRVSALERSRVFIE